MHTHAHTHISNIHVPHYTLFSPLDRDHTSHQTHIVQFARTQAHTCTLQTSHTIDIFPCTYTCTCMHSCKFIGVFKIPTASMMPPKSSRALRPLDECYLKLLTSRICANLMEDSSPLLVNIVLHKDAIFCDKNLIQYEFEIIGGNHSHRVCFYTLIITIVA